jgi:hypothetical protein
MLASVVLEIALLPAANALAVPVALVYQSDPQSGNTTFLLSYDSLVDFANANAASSVATANNLATGGYLAGCNATIPGSTVPEPHTLAMLLPTAGCRRSEFHCICPTADDSVSLLLACSRNN